MESKRILIIEDEPGVSEFLSQALDEAGYKSIVCATGTEGLAKLIDGEYDVALLDIMLPDMDGFDVLRKARGAGVVKPIMMLTARGGLDDKVRGLEGGADDYLPKPFKVKELLARVSAIMRRSQQIQTTLTCEDLRVDVITRRVQRGDRPIFLSTTEYNVLDILIRNTHRPVPKAEIQGKVWNSTDERDANIVEVYINHLRNKLEHHDQGRLLHTVRGKGYILGRKPK